MTPRQVLSGWTVWHPGVIDPTRWRDTWAADPQMAISLFLGRQKERGLGNWSWATWQKQGYQVTLTTVEIH